MVHEVCNCLTPKADPRFPVRTENTRGTQRRRTRRAKREATVFPMFGRYGRTFFRQTTRGVPKRSKDGRTRQERQEAMPADGAKTAESPTGYTPGIRRSGYSELRRRGAMEYPDL